MSKDFRDKCKLLSERLAILNNMLNELKQQIIVQDLSNEIGKQVKVGRTLISEMDWLDETDIGGESFNLNNKSEGKYRGYVIYTKKDYRTIGLGFLYKNEVVAPHMDFCVDAIIAKYSDVELDEITILIEEAINDINVDITYLNENTDICTHDHYYGEYNKGFESHSRYETISEVINNFKRS